jgi:hypothetical protein
MLHSLFEQVVLTINSQRISDNPDYYYFKAFLENAFTFNGEAKKTWLYPSGYYDEEEGDSVKRHSNFNNNESYKQRTAHFREDHSYLGAFSNEGAHLVGKEILK